MIERSCGPRSHKTLMSLCTKPRLMRTESKYSRSPISPESTKRFHAADCTRVKERVVHHECFAHAIRQLNQVLHLSANSALAASPPAHVSPPAGPGRQMDSASTRAWPALPLPRAGRQELLYTFA